MDDLDEEDFFLALQRRAEQAEAKLGRSGSLQFKFFHRVDSLGLSGDGADIGAGSFHDYFSARDARSGNVICVCAGARVSSIAPA